MPVNLSLGESEEQRLEAIAADITQTGNKSEAVRRMMDVFEHSADIARERNGMDAADASSGINTSEPLSLEEAREAAKNTSSTLEKTDILAAHIDHVSDYTWDRGDLVELTKSVLGCHRTTAYDYIDRLVAADNISEGPLQAVDIDDLQREFETLDLSNVSAGRKRQVRSADSVDAVIDLDKPDYCEEDITEALWRQVWDEFSDGVTHEQAAFGRAAADVAALTFDEYRERDN